MEIYDPVEPPQDTLKPNEEEVTGFEQKVSTVRKFVWGWTTSVQVQTRVEKKHTLIYTLREEHSSRGVNSLNKGLIGDSRGTHATSPHFVKLIKFYENIIITIFVSTWLNAN